MMTFLIVVVLVALAVGARLLLPDLYSWLQWRPARPSDGLPAPDSWRLVRRYTDRQAMGIVCLLVALFVVGAVGAVLIIDAWWPA